MKFGVNKFKKVSSEMHYQTVLSDSRQWEDYFECIFEIFTPTNLGLFKGLSTDKAIYSTFSLEMYCYILLINSTP